MTVYLVTEEIPYEGEETLAVFSTKEKAEDFKKSMEDRFANVVHVEERYYVREMRVDQP